MSGIAGICSLDGKPVESDDLKRMVKTLSCRGPDGSGIWNEGPIGLGHAMLQTTPESLHETLPAKNGRGDLSITSDARLDNRDKLISELGTARPSSAEITDSDLILAAYQKWGKDCPKRLLGDFAFAIWDSRRQMLFCARDHFGVKPFYYYRSDRLFVFASEIKALLCLGQVPRHLNEGRVADFLVQELEGIDQSCTFYEDLLRLPPAQFMTVDQAGTTSQSYWSLDPMGEIHYGSDDEYVEAFREVFTEALRCRLRCGSTVGVTLSGGLDSSSIVGVSRQLMSENGQQRLSTYSAVSDNGDSCAETRFINQVLDLGEFESHRVQAGQLSDYLSDLRHLRTHTDDPFDLSTMTLMQTVYIAARNQGAKVLLDGVDGDTVTSHGTAYLAYLLRAGSWRTAVSEALGATHFYRHYYSFSELLYGNSRAAFTPQVLRRLRRSLGPRTGFKDAIRNTFIRPQFARRMGLLQRLETLRSHGRTALFESLREEYANTLKQPYLTAGLERYDRVAAAYSVEPRHPFFDKRLVEFCMALPWQQKRRRGWTKTILRRAMGGILPESLCWRRGWEDLGWNFTQSWIALERKLLKRVILDDLEEVSEYVDVSAVRRSYQGYLSGRDDDEEKLWQLAQLLLWLRRTGAAA